jgi:hypothetical protein
LLNLKKITTTKSGTVTKYLPPPPFWATIIKCGKYFITINTNSISILILPNAVCCEEYALVYNKPRNSWSEY